MNVRDLLRKKGTAVYSTHPDCSLEDCLMSLNNKRVGALVVLDQSSCIRGIISERDILRTASEVREKMFTLKVSDAMTAVEKLITCTEECSVEEVMAIMTDNRIRHLPIVDNGRLVGMVSIGDVIKALHDEARDENVQMQNYIMGVRA